MTHRERCDRVNYLSLEAGGGGKGDGGKKRGRGIGSVELRRRRGNHCINSAVKESKERLIN